MKYFLFFLIALGLSLSVNMIFGKPYSSAESRAAAVNHWCCDVETKNVTKVKRTRSVPYTVIETEEVIVGYEPCGSTSEPYTSRTTTKSSIWSLFGTTTRSTTTNRLTMPSIPPCEYIPIKETRTHLNTHYKIEEYEVEVVTNICPVEHKRCCDGFKQLNNDCVSEADYDKYVALMALLG